MVAENDADRFSRNEALFGAEGQQKIASTRVAIVGVGGLGSHVVQQLAYLGVLHFSLVDFDIVTPSSLNRLVGAIEQDAVDATKKVVVAERMILGINSHSIVSPVDQALSSEAARQAIAGCEVVFGCLDHDIHRLDLNELAARFNKIYLDLATDVVPAGDGLAYGGRVVVCDGSRCLACLPEVLNQKAIAFERMNSDQREAHATIYGIPQEVLDGTGPSVVSINGVIASLAVTEFMVHITGLRTPVPQLTYLADRPVLRTSRDSGASDCYYCAGLRRVAAD